MHTTMQPFDLEKKTSFECNEAFDDPMCGQPIEHGSIRALVVTAVTWYDGRLGGAKIVTASEVEYRARDI